MAKSRIAEAYLQIVPSMGGFFQNLNTQLRPGLASTGSNAGSVIGSAMGSAITKAVDLAKLGAGLAAVGAGVAAGMVVKGGISRALNIEDAEMKLKALKYSAGEVKSISQSAMDAVLGTAYGFDSALKIAVTSLASGIPQGEGLTNYLKLITDAAVVSGAAVEDIGYIFNKVQANGRAYAQELNMLADRGLPIFSWIADNMNISVMEMRKMMKKGEISAQDFRDAIQANIGGAAKTAAETTRGYILNTKTALSRLGATLVGGSLPIVMKALKDFIPVIDALNAKSKEGAKAFWDRTASKITPAINEWSKEAVARLNAGGSLIPAFDNLKASVDRVYNSLHNMLVLVANSTPVTQIRIAAKITEEWFQSLRPISEIWQQTIIPAFGAFQTKVMEVRAKVLELWDDFKYSPVGAMLIGAAEYVKVWFENIKPVSELWQNSMLPAIKAFWSVAGPIFNQMISNWAMLATTLGPILVDAFTTLMPLFGQILGAIGGLVASMSVSLLPVINDIFTSLIGGLGDILPPIIDMIASVLSIVADSLVTLMPSITNAFTAIFGIVKQLIDILVPIIATIIPIITQILEILLPIIMEIGQAIFGVISEVLTALAPSIVQLVSSIGILIETVLKGLQPSLKELMPSIIGLVEIVGSLLVVFAQIIAVVINLAAAFIEVMAPAVSGIVGIIVGVLKGIVDVARTIVSIFVTIFASFASFLADGWNNLVDVLNSVHMEVPDWVTKLTGQKGTIGFNFQKVPKVTIPEPTFFAKGGNIAPSQNGTFGILAENGRAETVTDLGQTNAFINDTLKLVRKVKNENGNADQGVVVQITVNPSQGMSEEELANKIHKVFKRNQRTIRA